MIEYFVSNNEPNVINILILAIVVWLPLFSYRVFRERHSFSSVQEKNKDGY